MEEEQVFQYGDGHSLASSEEERREDAHGKVNLVVRRRSSSGRRRQSEYSGPQEYRGTSPEGADGYPDDATETTGNLWSV